MWECGRLLRDEFCLYRFRKVPNWNVCRKSPVLSSLRSGPRNRAETELETKADNQVTGLALPVLLAHSALIEPAACYMSIAGGGLVYGTILVYSGWFGAGGEDEF
jgi:hypothetical protein